MELRFKGKFNKDIANRSQKVSDEIRETIWNVKLAPDISKIQNLVKLKKHKVHYRVRIANDYRIGVVIRGNKIWFACFGHRSGFYKNFP